MKLVILVPSEEYKRNAGARIRYGRIARRLAKQGVTMALEEISSFDPRTAQCDVMLVSKCYDARALVAAEILSRRGVPVGVDLFDDYFSQRDDSRLGRFRLWLRQMLARADFAICSTDVMRQIIASYAPHCPVHLLADPAPPVDEDHLAGVLAEKLAHARASGEIRLAWFGVGDNPNFSVGLSDVAAFAGVLNQLGAGGMAVDLTILTNARALDPPRLAAIAELPVSAVTVDEWSEAAEAELLASAFACFLPVNAQGFSTAKSLNRAITALASGSQVLAAGYPLYAALQPLLYDRAKDLLNDLERGRMRLSASTLDAFGARIREVASPVAEADSFQAFLKALPSRKNAANADSPLYLVHGVATNGPAHKMAQSVGGLSVRTPFCTAQLNFDVSFERRAGAGLAMLVSDRALSKMLPDMRSRAVRHGQIGDRNFWEVSGGSISSSETAPTNASVPLEIALYPSMMDSVLAAVEAAFGRGAAIISETSPLPFATV